jgi:site-specific DNA-cytosine methylase
MKYAYSLKPPIIAIESVPGTWRALGGDLFKIRDMYAPEYGVAFVLDNSCHYGCMSIRKRLWHIHYRKDLFPNGLTWSRDPENKRSMREVLSGVDNLSNHIVSNTQQKTYENFRALFESLPPGEYANNWLRKTERWDLVSNPAMIKTKVNGEKFVFYESVASKKLSWDKPAPTITGSTILIHPEQGRPLTTREYLRINDMPDTFEFPPSVGTGKHITYIGKTVSRGIARWVIRNIKRNLEGL